MLTFGFLWRFSFSLGLFSVWKSGTCCLHLLINSVGSSFQAGPLSHWLLKRGVVSPKEAKGRRWVGGGEMALEFPPTEQSQLGRAFFNREYQNLSLIFKVVLCSDIFMYHLIAILVIFPCHLQVLGREEANNWKREILTDVRCLGKGIVFKQSWRGHLPDVCVRSTWKATPA